MTSSRKPAPKLQGLTGTYSPSPDGIDTSLLLLLHGLGDSAAPFANLARSLSLPQTATLALNAPLRVPFLEENNLQWWPSFDMATGDPLPHPDPSNAMKLLTTVLSHLTNDVGWPRGSIHVFGFAQGGSLALQTALSLPSIIELGSIVTISGPPLSMPAKGSNAKDVPILAYARKGDRAMKVQWKEAFANVQEVEVPARVGGPVQAMPRSREEWQPIMRFWSEKLKSRPSLGKGEELVELS